ncbi:hypothetical protein NDA16_002594 [Ustilago loliicola]|nr:hypothetical protein NDA16_002594 [Ustilago loliicola]
MLPSSFTAGTPAISPYNAPPPSLPPMPGLSRSPRNELLRDTLQGWFDNPAFNVKQWIGTLEFALLAEYDRNERIPMLKAFLDSRLFDQLITQLKYIADRLPESFVTSFLDCTGSVSARSARLKKKVDVETLFQRLEQLAFFPPRLDAVGRLSLLLQHAFVQDAPCRRQPDLSVRAPISDFTSTFNGRALEMLVDYIKIHNQLFPPPPPSPLPVHASPVSHSLPFIGDDDDDNHSHQLHQSVAEQTRDYYAKVLPIIQSSGFGKSRLCIQLSTVSPGMLVCLRKRPPSGQEHAVSSPPQDKRVYKYFDSIKVLLPHPEPDSDNGTHREPSTDQEHINFNLAHLRILAWLSAYCHTISYYLQQLRQASGCFDASANHRDRAACWRTVVFYFAKLSSFKHGSLFETPRNLCRQSRLGHLCTTHIPPSADNPLASIHTADAPPSLVATSAVRDKILEYICDLADTLATDMKQQYVHSWSDHELLTRAIGHHLSPRLNTMEQLWYDTGTDTFVFLALDECDTTWILLVDTNSNLAPLAGKEARGGSRRMAQFDTHGLTQPFSAMPLDVNLTSQDRQTLLTSDGGPVTMRQLNEFLPRFGRPLWVDPRYHGDGLIKPTAIVGKLVLPGEWDWPDNFHAIPSDPLDEVNQNLLAIASRRLHLDLSSKAGPKLWERFISHQIAEHLRFVGRIYSTTDSIKSSTPSEPPLSVAVAWKVRSQPSLVATRWSMMVQAIVNANAPIGLNVGAQGELGVALLCALAIDLVMSQRYATNLFDYAIKMPSGRSDINYTALYGLVSVHDWLRTLVDSSNYVDRTRPGARTATDSGSNTYHPGEDGDHDMADRNEADQGMPSHLAEWARRAWLNFTHPVILPKQVPHDSYVGFELLRELWIRHATAQGVSNQAGWDLLIPVYETDSDQPPNDQVEFEESRLSYIAIQVKNCINRPTPKVKEAAVGPRLPISREKQCLELFFDLKDPAQSRGHEYSQRRHPRLPSEDKRGIPRGPSDRTSSTGAAHAAAAKPKEEEGDAQSRLLLRHHVFISGLKPESLPVLKQLKGAATKQVKLLFGDADSLDTLEFDEAQAKYVRSLQSAELQRAWDEAQTRIDGGLVLLRRPSSTSTLLPSSSSSSIPMESDLD